MRLRLKLLIQFAIVNKKLIEKSKSDVKKQLEKLHSNCIFAKSHTYIYIYI